MRVFKPKRLAELEECGLIAESLSEITQFMVKEIKMSYQVDKVNSSIITYAARRILASYPSLEAIGLKKIVMMISARFTNEATQIQRTFAKKN